MARRRYLSTDISKDTRVNRLAVEYGDFAALLYTWFIPHAADDGSLPADFEEVLYLVMPGRRDKGIEDVESAVKGMVTLGLLAQEGKLLRFPESFFRYQTYVNEQRRQRAGSVPSNESEQRPAAGSVPSIKEVAQNAADRRTPAQNGASFKSSFSSKSSFPFSVSEGGEEAASAAEPPTEKKAPRKTEITDDFIEMLVSEFGPRLGGVDRVRAIVADALAHKNRSKWDDKKQYLRGWLRRDAENFEAKGRANGRGQPSVSAAAARFVGVGQTFTGDAP